jgi:hypothetical protein
MTGEIQVGQSQPRVFVDAKIIGRHEPSLPKECICRIFLGRCWGPWFCPIDADQTDEAELKAISFAIEALGGKLQSFKIMCDNESVVSQINRALVRPSSRRVLLEILAEMKANHGITVEFFGKNPAHSFLNEELARLQE